MIVTSLPLVEAILKGLKISIMDVLRISFAGLITLCSQKRIFLCWLDNTLLAKENLVYVDESIKDNIDEFLYIDFKRHFKDWLYRLITYFGIRLENYKEEKSLYHLYRVESLVRHYKETGKFEYYFSKENYELAKDLKTKLNIEEHLPKLKEIFSYLLSLYKEEKS